MKLGEARLLWTLLLVAAAAAVPAARGLWLDLPSSGSKCVSEELHNNAVVLADYYAFIGEDYDVNATVIPTITVKVTSPYGNNIHHNEKVTHGQFAFTATEAGNYLACFSLDGDQGGKKVTVGIDWKTGIAAKDWDSVARKEKIEVAMASQPCGFVLYADDLIDGLELELKKLEEAVETIHTNLYHLIDRESEMRGVSERTNARVAWYSLMALTVCIVVSILQLLYLRRYFRKKKLI